MMAFLIISRILVNQRKSALIKRLLITFISLLIKANYIYKPGYYEKEYFLIKLSILLRNRYIGNVEGEFIIRILLY